MPGYSGVAIYTKNATCAPIRAEEGVTGVLTLPKTSTSYRDLPLEQQIGGYPRPGQLSGDIDDVTLDSEGRCIILEFPAFVLFGVYSPANRDATRINFRESYLEALDARVRNLVQEGKQVILTGDLNVIRSPLDTSRLAESLRKEGMTVEDWISNPSRRILNQLLFEGTVSGERDEERENPILWDLCRNFHPHREGMNTCWDTKRNTRPANHGSRIDYVLCSDGLKDWVVDANIQEGLMGSDHCPVYATFSDTVLTPENSSQVFSALVNPPGMFKGAQRLRDWEARDLCPLSARLIPEFDRRQSIRDMFTKRAGPSVFKQTTSGEAALAPTSVRSGAAADAREDHASAAAPVLAVKPLTPLSNSGSTSTHTPLDPSPKRTLTSKRLAEEPSVLGRPQKHSRASTESSTAKGKTIAGQKTLQGFFKATTSPVRSNMASREPRSKDAPLGETSRPVPIVPSHPTRASFSQQGIQNQLPPTSPTTTPSKIAETRSPEKIFDPIEAKESWSKLLGKRVLPRCEHNEPCISLLTKKPGVNCGKLHLRQKMVRHACSNA